MKDQMTYRTGCRIIFQFLICFVHQMCEHMTRVTFFCLLLTTTFQVITVSAQKKFSSLPVLEKQGVATRLLVENKPFLVLGGELGNSSASSLEYMSAIWPKL